MSNAIGHTNSWVYQLTEPGLWTVGFYDPQGRWHTDSDYDIKEVAAERVAWLNGNSWIDKAVPEIKAEVLRCDTSKPWPDSLTETTQS